MMSSKALIRHHAAILAFYLDIESLDSALQYQEHTDSVDREQNIEVIRTALEFLQ